MRNNRIRVFLTLCIISLLSIFVFSSNVIVKAEVTTLPSTTIASGTEGESGNEENGGGEGSGENTEEEIVLPTFEGFVITTGVITDEYLYSALLELYSDYFKSINGQAYTGTTIYSDMFKDFTSINLDKKNITSLDGLDKLELFKLETFSANSNLIKEFRSDHLANTEDWVLKTISLADNNLTSVDFSGLLGVNNINLSSNLLTSVDFAELEGRTSGTIFTVNLANNRISSFNNIILLTKRVSHYKIIIINHNITEIDDVYFSDKYSLNIGVQGFNVKENSNTDTVTNLVVYKTNIEGLSLDIYKIDGEADELVATVSDNNISEGRFIRLNLKVGKYKFVYNLNGEEAYSKDYENKYYLKYCEFSVLPQKVNCVYVHKNKEYVELGKVTGKVTVKLSSNDEGAKIFYQVNNGEWIEGNVVECSNGGNYSIKVKSVVDGVESLEQSIWVRTSLNLYIPDALMLVLILLLALVLFLVVLPIVSKKYFKKD